jgi:hypothetical protein
MRCNRTAGVGLLACVLLLSACGEEIAEQQVVPDEPLQKPACELIEQVDLQQIFVNKLAPDTASASSNQECTLMDEATGEPFVRYSLHPYREDLKAQVRATEQDRGDSINARFVQGIGDSAVWTDVGLFANRNGRTLQVQPLQDEENKAPYQELARLLLTRLEDS